MIVGIEVGGTFTDLVAIDGGRIRIAKVPSTPASPDRGALAAILATETRDSIVVDLVGCLGPAVAPRLVVVEDVHWADPFTLQAVARLASVTAQAPAILNLTSRKENDPLDDGWRATVGDLPWVTMELSSLRPAEAAALAATSA